MKLNTRWIAALSVVVATLFVVSHVQAQEPTPAADAAAGAAVVVEAAPAVVDAGCETCCAPKYCISYYKHCLLRRVCCNCCAEPYTAMLKVKDPCTCCEVEVPVCVPGCCTDAPCVSCRRGLFGRTITDYSWCCGYRVRIIMSRRGTVAVHTYGF